MRAQVAIVCLLVVGASLGQAWPWDKKDSEKKQEVEEEAKVVAPTTSAPTTSASSQVDEIKTLTLTRDGQSQQAGFGFRLANVKQSLLVAEVAPESPAARAGLKFGDQVLTVNGDTPMGRQLARVHEWIAGLPTLVLTYKPAPYNRRVVLVRRPGESDYGFEVDDEAEIEMVYSDTPAVRAGLMTDHVVLSVNGQPTGGAGYVVEDLVPKATGPELVLEVMPSNFYFAIKKNVDFEASDDDGQAFGQYETEQEAGGGEIGSAIGGAIGGAAGSILGSELVNTDSELPDDSEESQYQEYDEQDYDEEEY